MQERRFEFAAASGPPVAITLVCRKPPEAQASKTLTWQLEPPGQQQEQAGGDGAERERLAAAAAPPPDLIGLDIWPASVALCRFLAVHPQLVVGQDLLELGAGMGMVGLLCAKLGAALVLLTDYEPLVVQHLQRNVRLNGQQQACSTHVLDFRAAPDGPPVERHGGWRLAVAADVLYCEAIAAPLVATLQRLLHPQGMALIGHQVRRAIVLDPTTRLPRLEDSDGPLEAFCGGCAAAGLRLRTLSSRPTCSNVDNDPMVLLAIEHPDGHKVQVGTKGVTRPGEVRWFQGEVTPQFEKTTRGDMWVEFSVAFPREVSEQQRQQLRQLFSGDREWQRRDEL